MPAPLAAISAALLAAALNLGCGMSVTFSQTDTRFSPRRAPRIPLLFVDRWPDRPYASVGIIDVSANGYTPRSEIIEAVLRKARAVGCDLVVDPAVHWPGAGYGPAGARWSIVLGEDEKDRDEVAPAPARPSPLLGQAPPATPTYQPYLYPPPLPPIEREFICGVYLASPPWPPAR